MKVLANKVELVVRSNLVLLTVKEMASTCPMTPHHCNPVEACNKMEMVSKMALVNKMVLVNKMALVNK